jgi:hypothetical protein
MFTATQLEFIAELNDLRGSMGSATTAQPVWGSLGVSSSDRIGVQFVLPATCIKGYPHKVSVLFLLMELFREEGFSSGFGLEFVACSVLYPR